MNSFEQFKAKASLHYGGKYDYSEFEYVNAKTPSVIICPIHGRFTQKPDHHVRVHSIGCPSCVPLLKRPVSKEIVRSKDCLSKEDYLKRATHKYGDRFKYDLSRYEGLTKGVVTITCSIHGDSEYTPQAHLISTCGCKFCGMDMKNRSKTKSYEELMDDFQRIYKGKYSYPESNKKFFVNRKSSIEVVCPKHGIFTKTAQKHLSGQGCFKCKMEELVSDGKLPGGYCEELFRGNPELKSVPAKVYYLRIDSNIYKIGITRVNTSNRIKGLVSKSKGIIEEVEILQEITVPLYEAYQLEQKVLSDFSPYRIYTFWSTELFNRNVLEGVDLESLL